MLWGDGERLIVASRCCHEERLATSAKRCSLAAELGYEATVMEDYHIDCKR
jgi:hypothetical protein